MRLWTNSGWPGSRFLPESAFYAFGLIALLYLVTEELPVEAQEGPEKPFATAMFFVGFRATLTLELLMRQ